MLQSMSVLPLHILQMYYIHVCMFDKETVVLWPQLHCIFSSFCPRVGMWAVVAPLLFVRVRSGRALCMFICTYTCGLCIGYEIRVILVSGLRKGPC